MNTVKVDFRAIQPGDIVTRKMGSTLTMTLRVTGLSDQFIHCGSWKFDRTLGYEVDEDLDWGVPDEQGQIHSGSMIVSFEKVMEK